jgi:hypothetical protein
LKYDESADKSMLYALESYGVEKMRCLGIENCKTDLLTV